jgi:uncharacterized protein (DUF433 family)
MIVVNPNINGGKPSIANRDGKYETVKGIVNFVKGGVEIDETCTELKLSKVDVLSAIEYAKLYPQVLE